MQNRTAGAIATVITILLCGCPGLLALCFGITASVSSVVPGAEIDIFGSQEPKDAMLFGVGAFCLGVIFILIPIVVGFFTLRKKTGQSDAATIDASSFDIPSTPTDEAVTKRTDDDIIPPPS